MSDTSWYTDIEHLEKIFEQEHCEARHTCDWQRHRRPCSHTPVFLTYYTCGTVEPIKACAASYMNYTEWYAEHSRVLCASACGAPLTHRKWTPL